VRYRGQGYELTVDWSTDFVPQFHRLHEQRYGYSDPERRVEIVNARVRMIASTEPLQSERKDPRKGDGKQAIIKDKSIYYENQGLEAAVYDRSRLNAGDRFQGPAVIVEYSATSFVPPGSTAAVDEYMNIIIDS
jgi:N-methylhydantoinase A